MSTTSINRLMATVFLLICISFIVMEIRQKPRVFVLHSYHQEYSWAQKVSDGITDVLEGKPYSLRWHYMDTKRHPDEAYKQRSISSVQRVIDQWQPHVVISIADNAQLAMKPYINQADSDIVFSGVFADPVIYGYDENAKNVTGILERWPLGELKRSIEEIFVDQALAEIAKQRPIVIQHVGDDSTTGRIVAQQLADFDWGKNIIMKTISVADMDSWRDAIEMTNQNADLAMFSLYHTLYRHKVGSVPKDKQSVMTPKEVQKWTQQHLDLPSVGGWGFFVEHGGMLSIAVSAYEQGEQAAQLALKIIDKQITPSQLPIRQSKEFSVHMREELLQKHQIEVPVIYQAFARATNNYYD